MDKLSNRELLAILIRVGYRGNSALDISDEILKMTNGVAKLPSTTLKDLMKVKGIKKAKGIELVAVFELVKRCHYQMCLDVDIIDSPKVVISWLQKELGSLKQEHFLVVFLDTKNHIIATKSLYIGGLNSSVVHPREIFKEAFSRSASKLIIVHNHPSQDVTPSSNDIEVTNNLCEVAKIMNIPIIDHIIVSGSNYFSFKENSLL